MQLNDRQLKDRMRDKVSPWEEDLVQPASLDVRLGSVVLIPMGTGTKILVIGTNVPEYREQRVPYVLAPDEFALFHTLETLTMPTDLVGRFEGKSSLGRLGLMTHITAGFIDPGFQGQLTLELKNVGRHRLELREGVRIGQIAFFEIETPELIYGDKSLRSHYQGSRGAVGCRVGTKGTSDV